MNTWKKLAALVGAGALAFAMFGTALAAAPGPSTQGVTPVLHDGNVTADGNGNSDKADCDVDDAVEIGSADLDAEGDASATSENGVTVNFSYDAETKESSFTATGGLVTIAYIKGGSAYNGYHYTMPGVASDGHLYAPDNASEGPAGLSHAVFCTGPVVVAEPTPTFEETLEAETDAPTDEPTDEPEFSEDVDALTESPTDTIGKTGTTSPADGAWLLVVALGVLLASIVVLTPARAKSQR